MSCSRLQEGLSEILVMCESNLPDGPLLSALSLIIVLLSPLFGCLAIDRTQTREYGQTTRRVNHTPEVRPGRISPIYLNFSASLT